MVLKRDSARLLKFALPLVFRRAGGRCTRTRVRQDFRVLAA